MTDDRVQLGAVIMALHDPHRGFERAFNRWYERDHMLAAAMMAPWTISGERFVATRQLKDLRYPAEGPFGPAERGSYLAVYWVQAGRLADQQAWVLEEMKKIAAQGRNFAQRDAVSATTYDHVANATRDPDGVPPELALDRHYPGVVLLIGTRTGRVGFDDFARTMLDDVIGKRMPGSDLAVAVGFTPRPKEPWWPADAPEVEGVGDRLFVLCFVESDPRSCWETLFANLGDDLAATGSGRLLLAAPFIPVVRGTDTYVDQLW